jgi:hypothetical protein
MGIFGIPSKDDQAIKNIVNLEDNVLVRIREYHSRPDFNKKKMLDEKELLLFIEGDLLRTYTKQLEVKDKEAKYFFKDLYFKDYVDQSITKIYTLSDQLDAGSKKNSNSNQKRLAAGAEESFGKIYEYSQKITKYKESQNENNGTQRSRR